MALGAVSFRAIHLCVLPDIRFRPSDLERDCRRQRRTGSSGFHQHRGGTRPGAPAPGVGALVERVADESRRARILHHGTCLYPSYPCRDPLRSCDGAQGRDGLPVLRPLVDRRHRLVMEKGPRTPCTAGTGRVAFLEPVVALRRRLVLLDRTRGGGGRRCRRRGIPGSRRLGEPVAPGHRLYRALRLVAALCRQGAVRTHPAPAFVEFIAARVELGPVQCSAPLGSPLQARAPLPASSAL